MKPAFFGPILKIFVRLAVLLMLIGGPVRLPAAAAQMQMPSAAPQGQPPPAKLLPGMGNLHHAIATTNGEAQKFFDQGLTLVYAFNFLEAYHSFQRAAELDPEEPMPHWGAALAIGPNYNSDTTGNLERAAFREIQRAKALEANAPQNEQDYVAALSELFSGAPQPDHQKLAENYAAAMRNLHSKYPDDPDAATLFAVSLMDLHPWHLWSAKGEPLENTNEIVSVLEATLRRWPEHAGANHFYIHTMEASVHPEIALPSAKRLETLVPGAGHLAHMPAHIYIHTGAYAAAVKSNEAAVAADHEYMRTKEIPNQPYMTGYVEHNLYFLVYCAMMAGGFRVADGAAKELAERATSEPDLTMAAGFRSMQALVLLRFARWDSVLNLPDPGEKLPVARVYWQFARSCALAAKGDAEKAEAGRQTMEAMFAKLPPGPQFNMSARGWGDFHKIADEVLSARIAAARHEDAKAIEHWRAAVAIQDASEYSELPEWYYPVRESLGAALLREGQAREAEAVFRADLEHNKLNPRSLFGLDRALAEEKQEAEEKQVRQQFDTAWKSADTQLSLADF
ncbi:MAG TPA: hypothetical protein VN862_01145 [Candidatus Acidoferrales bacterium]|nr:hypothetical protein [Candidatus Acidoferrales bacterium]